MHLSLMQTLNFFFTCFFWVKNKNKLNIAENFNLSKSRVIILAKVCNSYIQGFVLPKLDIFNNFVLRFRLFVFLPVCLSVSRQIFISLYSCLHTKRPVKVAAYLLIIYSQERLSRFSWSLFSQLGIHNG